MESRFNAVFIDPSAYKPIYHSSAFRTPVHPIITNEAPDRIQFFSWGLIPFWVKDEAKARKIVFNTFNARAETIFEKPSFKFSINKKRCLVLVDGFFEWHEAKGNKYPYHIRLTDSEAFALAGIWETWENKKTGEQKNTFSIITTTANPLLERIHNTKKRMPMILKTEDEERWLDNTLTPEDIKSILIPFDENALEAFTVSKLISSRSQNTNVPEVQKKVEYDELQSKQSKLF
jgi:putative SOS response-associated peptidase YedK